MIRSYHRILTLVLASVLATVCHSTSRAQDAADKKQASKQESTKKAAPDRYAVPKKASAEELVKFITELARYTPNNQLEAQLHRRRLAPALSEAAKLILTKEKDKQSKAYAMGQGVLFELRIAQLPQSKEADRKKLVDDMIAYYKLKKELGGYEFHIGRLAATRLEQMNSKYAARAFRSFGEKFVSSKAPQLAAMAKGLVGAARRLELPGKTMDVTGKTFDGKPFDLKKLKGKVVLVDFWATWCGPCVAEYPNILRLYEKYHGQGFEVVGISLDQSRFRLEQYLQQKKVPWVTLHDPNGTGQHPAAVHYGVFSIPRMILINREGKVISLQARGEDLANQLAKQFAKKKE